MKHFLRAGTLALCGIMMIALFAGCGVFHKLYCIVDGEQYCYIWGRQKADMKQIDLPSKEGYTFSGWFEDEAMTIPYEWPEKMPSTDVTVYGSLIPNDDPDESEQPTAIFEEDTETAAEEPSGTAAADNEAEAADDAEAPEEDQPSIHDIESALG